jgi:hypothetical protein
MWTGQPGFAEGGARTGRRPPQQAAPDADMAMPLSEVEEEIIRVLRWTSRKSRGKNEYFQFTYKKPCGPGGKLNQSVVVSGGRW